jgi:hypothetical protein
MEKSKDMSDRGWEEPVGGTEKLKDISILEIVDDRKNE